jgi:hypothetical protein
MMVYDFTEGTSGEVLKYTVRPGLLGRYKILHGKKQNIPGPKYLLMVSADTPAQEIDVLILATLELFQESGEA